MAAEAAGDTGRLLLGGRYRLESSLRFGGMSEVWRAHDELLRRPVAVKLLTGGLAADVTFLARFRSEALHAAGINHANIASVYDYGEDTVAEGGQPLAFLVMELVEGSSLADLLARCGRLDVDQTLRLVGQAAVALAAAHAAGVVHRDIKPANILLRSDGVVKITDFGVAWSAASAPLTGEGQVMGTAHYLSPEQARGAKGTPASDVYALGLVAYECLSGRRAFDGEDAVDIAMRQVDEQPPPLPPTVAGPVRGLIGQAVAKDPQQRFADGAAFAAAIWRLLDDTGPILGRSATSPIGDPVLATPVDEPATSLRRLAALPTVAAPAPAAASNAIIPAYSPRRGLTRRRRLTAGVLAAVIVVATLVAAVFVGVQLPGHSGHSSAAAPAGRASPRSSGTPVSSTTTASTAHFPTATSSTTTAEIAPPVTTADLIGWSIDAVRARLTTAGLQVRLNPVTTGALPAGQVTDITPAGQLTAGQTATVTYVKSPTPRLH